MNIQFLSLWDLTIAAGLIIALAGLSYFLKLGFEKALLLSATRAALQLLLIGLVLKTIFMHAELHWVALMAVVMLAVATREINARQKFTSLGFKKFALHSLSLFISSFTLAFFALTVVIQNDPWFTPQYTLPLM